ncbi:Uncharacterised protein [Raoultella planticola]|uniref:Uncharacterized protein n=1 Tax=Raoultella planticola TaxID=575 RepID=A0A485ARL6_RAOPL|nr:Uncharacterised protein [Raoultella planticola]
MVEVQPGRKRVEAEEKRRRESKTASYREGSWLQMEYVMQAHPP